VGNCRKHWRKLCVKEVEMGLWIIDIMSSFTVHPLPQKSVDTHITKFECCQFVSRTILYFANMSGYLDQAIFFLIAL
jgi:hypothetical protein